MLIQLDPSEQPFSQDGATLLAPQHRGDLDEYAAQRMRQGLTEIAAWVWFKKQSASFDSDRLWQIHTRSARLRNLFKRQRVDYGDVSLCSSCGDLWVGENFCVNLFEMERLWLDHWFAGCGETSESWSNLLNISCIRGVKVIFTKGHRGIMVGLKRVHCN